MVIASRSREKLENAVKEFKSVGSKNITPITCNIRKEDEVKWDIMIHICSWSPMKIYEILKLFQVIFWTRALITETLGLHGKIDFLVNNGGGQFMSHAADMSLKGWNAVIDTNLTGTYLVMRESMGFTFYYTVSEF